MWEGELCRRGEARILRTRAKPLWTLGPPMWPAPRWLLLRLEVSYTWFLHVIHDLLILLIPFWRFILTLRFPSSMFGVTKWKRRLTEAGQPFRFFPSRSCGFLTK